MWRLLLQRRLFNTEYIRIGRDCRWYAPCLLVAISPKMAAKFATRFGWHNTNMNLGE